MEGYTAQCHGVCRAEGRAVFVPGALAGEQWRVRVTKVTSSTVWGRGEELLEPSAARIKSDCPAYPRCGGCAARHMTYAEELAMKRQRVDDALRRIGALTLTVDDILPAEGDGFARRKVIFNVGEQAGRPVAGFYRARSHDIVPAPDCPAVPAEARAAAAAVLEWMESFGIPAYDEAAAREGVRHIFYRSSRLTGECVVTLIVSRSPGQEALEALAAALRERCAGLRGFVLNRNCARGNTVLAGEFETFWGSDTLTEGLCGLRFSLSPRSFFQVNPPQAEKLYEKALEYAQIRPGTRALDLYCGTGTIGLCMAARGAQVIGAEIVPAAVENARRNALDNALADRCEFLCADAGEAAAEFRRRGAAPEVIVVDPPRKGLSVEVIDAAAGMAPERIVYVSCDPGTLARDLAIFAQKGYAAVKATAVDMFPRTSHVETVVLLRRKNIDDHLELTWTDEEFGNKGRKATYEELKSFILETYGLRVSQLNIAQIKRKCGIIERENYNLPKSEDSRQPNCTPEKEEAIMDAFMHFKMI